MLCSEQQLRQRSDLKVSCMSISVGVVMMGCGLIIIDKRHLTMEDLEESCKEEIAKTATRLGFRRQDSDTRHMYN